MTTISTTSSRRRCFRSSFRYRCSAGSSYIRGNVAKHYPFGSREMRMLSLLCCAVLLTGCDRVKEKFSGPKTEFDGNAAFAYAKTHLEVGPRIPGTPAHEKAADWIVAEMKKRTDSVVEQRWTQTTKNGTKLQMR